MLRKFFLALDYLQYLLVRLLAGLVNSLPIEISTWIARRFGDFFHFLLPSRRRIALENLNIAFQDTLSTSQKKSIAREAFRNLATSIMEFFRIPSIINEAHERFEMEGTEHLDQAFAKGKGIVFVVSHLGSWEYLEMLFYLRDYPCTVVVRGVKNPFISKWIQTLRERTRIRAIDRVSAAKGILRSLKQNEMVAILIDQWAGRDGLWIDFFSEKTSTTSIPVRLAAKTGAALIPGYCIRSKTGSFKILIRPEVLVDLEDKDFEEKTTEKLNRQLETEIKSYPEQWTWTHRRWKNIKRHQKIRSKTA